MIAIESPTAARVAVTAASPSSSRRGSTPDLQRAEAFVTESKCDSARSGAGSNIPHDAYAGSASTAPPNSVATGNPGDLASDIPQCRLERPVPTGVEVDRLEGTDMPGDGQRILTDEQVLERLEAIHRVAEPMPTSPRRSRRGRS
jgi:hypothetical protein